MRSWMIGALVALTMGGSAEAGDWLYASHSDNSAVAIDVSTVRRQGSRMTFWTVWVSRKREATASGEQYDYHLTRRTIDCDRDTWSEGAAIYYRISESASVHIDERSTAENHTIPDSLAQGISNVACSEIEAGRGVSTANEFAAVIREMWGEL